jgi:uncharacterized membrane protein
MNSKTKKLVLTALLAAFTTIATMIIKFPTPTLGYIHLGDSLVLLCGIILGPFGGALSAGIGSMFADIFSGYVSFAPGTLVIKGLTAMIAGYIFHKSHLGNTKKIILASIPAELFMVLGYFVYEILLAIVAAQSTTLSAFLSAMAASATGIPFNLVQGVVGIIIALALLPILLKIDEIRDCINR